MKAKTPRFVAAVRWALRLVLSSLFLYAGAMKLRDATAFAESVASFHLLPGSMVTLVALGLPPFEILAALLALTGGQWGRAGAFALLTLLLAFTGAIGSALARGLPVDCGCFGPDHLDILSPTKNLWFAFGRDLVLTALAGMLYADRTTSVYGCSAGGSTNENTPSAQRLTGC